MSQNPFARSASARPTLAKAARHCPYPKTRGGRSGPAWSASTMRGRRVLLGAARRDTGVAALSSMIGWAIADEPKFRGIALTRPRGALAETSRRAALETGTGEN